MNLLTPIAREEFLTGDRDWLAGTYKVGLMPDSYTFSAAHIVLSDLPSALWVGTFTGRAADDGLASADDDVISGVSAGEDYRGMWVYDDTGTPSTSRLVAWIDTQANSTPLAGTTSGLDIAVNWSAGVFRI